MMNIHKLFMSLTVLLSFNLSTSFSADLPTLETPKFLSYSAWKRLQNLPSPAEELSQIDEQFDDCRTKLVPLKEKGKEYDRTWDALDRLQKQGKVPRPKIIQILCKAHEQVFWDIFDLNEELRELEQRKNELIKREISFNMDLDALVPNDVPT